MTVDGRRLGMALLPAAVTALVAGGAWATASWGRLGVPSVDPGLIDLRTITYTADCMAAGGSAWGAVDDWCDVLERYYYNYPSPWARAAALVGLGYDDTAAVGIALLVGYVLAIAIVAWLALGTGRQWWTVTATTLAAVSVPALLAVERGNVDLAVLLLVALACLAYHHRARATGALLLAVATVLKLFPLGSALMLLVDAPRRRPLLVYGVATALGLAAIATELPDIARNTPQLTDASFGVSVMPMLAWRWMGLPLVVVGPRVPGWALLALGVLIVLGLQRRWGSFGRAWQAMVERTSADRTAALLLLAGAGAVVLAYAVGTSFDYRMTFLIPAIAGLTRVPGRLPVAGVISMLAAMTLSIGLPDVQLAGDVLWLALAPALLVLVAQVALGRVRMPAGAGTT